MYRSGARARVNIPSRDSRTTPGRSEGDEERSKQHWDVFICNWQSERKAAQLPPRIELCSFAMWFLARSFDVGKKRDGDAARGPRERSSKAWKLNLLVIHCWWIVSCSLFTLALLLHLDFVILVSLYFPPSLSVHRSPVLLECIARTTSESQEKETRCALLDNIFVCFVWKLTTMHRLNGFDPASRDREH